MRAVLGIGVVIVTPAAAQVPPVETSGPELTASGDYPGVVSVKSGKPGLYYADAQGRTLYALNMRLANSRSGASLTYCIGPCAQSWTPLAASADAEPVGQWTVLAAAQGPQWAYRKNLVFTYNADHAPGDITGDGVDALWSVIRHIPAMPSITAPASVKPRFLGDRYVLTDVAGHRLFTAAQSLACAAACADWAPLAAGMVTRSIGEWSVTRAGDTAQWAFRGKPVYASLKASTSALPEGATPLLP